MKPCHGIDLGTTASVIGLVVDGTPHLFPIAGSELLPSVVLYPAAGEPLVGHPALNALLLDPTRGVLSSKRQMGTNHRYDVGGRTVTPVDVAEQILRALADGVVAAGGERPERVVITVPAWFTQPQRADTRLAGERAGFQVERIINEPTAAALAHAHGQELTRRVLVYDLGGGTFDVSVVDQDGVVVEVKASHGDSRLGGDDIDLALTDEVLRRLAASDRALRDAVDASPAARIRLRLAVEQAKIDLSEATRTVLRVPYLLDLDGKARHLELPLDRADVDAAAAPFIDRTLRLVDRVLTEAGVDAKELDELLLVGGSTLQPLVWHALHDRYGLEGSYAIDPRRSVALGAAIQGAIIDGSTTAGILVDVAPYPLSVGAATGVYGPTHFACRVLTPRNAPLPSRHSELFRTMSPDQKTLKMPIFQGSSVDPRRNALLGEVRLDQLPPAPEGEQGRPIRVVFRHDLDGLVQIEVTDELSGRSTFGRLAIDGAEQATLRAELEELLERQGLDYPEAEDETDGPPDPGIMGLHEVPAPSADLGEAIRTFEQVVAAERRLRATHGTAGGILVDLATAGLAQANAGQEAEALASYDAISDKLFTLGVYL